MLAMILALAMHDGLVAVGHGWRRAVEVPLEILRYLVRVWGSQIGRRGSERAQVKKMLRTTEMATMVVMGLHIPWSSQCSHHKKPDEWRSLGPGRGAGDICERIEVRASLIRSLRAICTENHQ